MASVDEHYDEHLGPIYSWMIGDVEAAMSRNRDELEALGFTPGVTGVAVDLGAGPGLHAIPLSELGFSVVALDSCASLVEELRLHAGNRPVQALQADLLRFREQIDGAADAILCMGDTLTHLPSRESVGALLEAVAAALAPSGAFLATFRDYVSAALVGTQRFIPVRSDERRILTCFLEYADDVVIVHDLLHERGPEGWQLRVSNYPKLRLDPAWVADSLSRQGLAVQRDSTPSGMVRIFARREQPA